MRWRPNPRTASLSAGDMALLTITAPIWGPAVAIIAAAMGVIWCKRRLIGPSPEWRPWFAWFPITFDTWPEDEKWPIKERVWLEWIERRAGHFLGDAEHRCARDHA